MTQRALFTLALVGLLTACERTPHPDRTAKAGSAKGSRASGEPRPGARKLPKIDDKRGLMFIFFDRRAELRTVEQVARVEPTARSAVQVLDPGHRLDGDRIIVADLRKKEAGGYRRWVMTRSAWLARAMPKYSRLEKPLKAAPAVADDGKKAAASKLAAKRRRARLRRLRRLRAKRKAAKAAQAKAAQAKAAQAKAAQAKAAQAKAAAAKAAAAKAQQPRVLLFSTSWCPSCKRARAYFLRRKVRFVEFDVERDPRAARHFLLIQKRAGLRPGVVPLIMVGNRAFQGFSEQRMEQVLIRYGVLKNP